MFYLWLQKKKKKPFPVLEKSITIVPLPQTQWTRHWWVYELVTHFRLHEYNIDYIF